MLGLVKAGPILKKKKEGKPKAGSFRRKKKNDCKCSSDSSQEILHTERDTKQEKR